MAIIVGVTADHHACALGPDGTRMVDQTLPEDQTRVGDLLTSLGQDVVIVVDQPATLTHPAIATARNSGCTVAYLLGASPTMRGDAYMIADTARTTPHGLRLVDSDSLALSTLATFDEDLAHQIAQAFTQIRSVLTRIHPELAAVLIESLSTRLVVDLLETFGGPFGLAAAGREDVLRFVLPRFRHEYEAAAYVDRIFTVTGDQEVVAPTPDTTPVEEVVVQHRAGQIKNMDADRAWVTRTVEKLVTQSPAPPQLH